MTYLGNFITDILIYAILIATSLGRFTKYIFSLLELFISNNLLSLCPALYFISTTQIKYKGSLGVNPAHWSASGVDA